MSNSSISDHSTSVKNEAEAAVLGSVILDPGRLAEVSAVLTPGDFGDPFCAAIFRVMTALAAEGVPVDCVTVLDRIKDDETSVIRDPAVVLGEIAGSVPTAAHAAHYAKIVRDAAIKRSARGEVLTALAELDNGQPTSTVLAEWATRIETLRDRADRDGEIFPVFTPKELIHMQDDAAEYAVEDVIASGQNGTISGIYKSLKTSTTCDLAVSLSTATPFLNEFHVPQACNVLLMSAESGWRKITDTCQRICARREKMEFGDNSKLLVSTIVPRVGDPIDRQKLERTAVQHEAEFIFLDPGYRALGHIGIDAANIFRVGEMLGEVDKMSERIGATIFIVHHFHKHAARTHKVPDLGDITQSGFAEWSRQWVLLGPRRPWDPHRGQHWMWLVYGGSEGHAGEWGLDVYEGKKSDPAGQDWDVTLLPAEQARHPIGGKNPQNKHDKLETVKNAIVKALYDAPDQRETERGIRATVGQVRQLKDAIEALAADDIIVPCKVQKAGQGHDGWMITPD